MSDGAGLGRDGDGEGDDRLPGRRGPRRAVTWVGATAALLVLGWEVVALPPFSATATVAVLLTGLAAVAVGWSSRRPGRGQRIGRGWMAWAGLALAGAAWQLAAWVQHPRHEHPTLSLLVNALLDSRPARAAAFVAWLLAAVELARR